MYFKIITQSIQDFAKVNLLIIVSYHSPGPLGDFSVEMDMFLSLFPTDSTPLRLLGDINVPSDKL